MEVKVDILLIKEVVKFEARLVTESHWFTCICWAAAERQLSQRALLARGWVGRSARSRNLPCLGHSVARRRDSQLGAVQVLLDTFWGLSRPPSLCKIVLNWA